ncbi:MAG: tRNA preQ1(34) S-adenosylmethionine ribosyltransferase-isomerase QueA [Spirochaetota bacterium]
MKTTDFSFDLPDELIAQHPSEHRGESRLMVLDRTTGRTEHRTVADLPDLVAPRTVMVFNDSRVRKARLYGRPVATGAHAAPVRAGDAGDRDGGDREFLLVRELPDHPPRTGWEAMTKKPRRLKPDDRIAFPGGRTARVVGHREMFVMLRFDSPLDEAYFARHGHVPLPPYIEREDAPEDEERYQTVYAKEPGSVAAPTAGLHFTPRILDELRARGVRTETVRLHVGIGTFLPVRVEDIGEHTMHEEECELTEETARRLNEARAEGHPLLAVGTTTVRTLESAWDPDRGELVPFRGETDIFIRPGHQFGAVDMLFTNFHTPRSTLLMLVSAFAGRETILAAYEEAVRERYRFFSYGDAMLIR